MQRMTIVKIDNIVVIDGEYYTVDCSDLPENFHALMWIEAEGQGEIEWNGKPKPQNTVIKNLNDYKIYINRWNNAKAAMLALAANSTSNTATSNGS